MVAVFAKLAQLISKRLGRIQVGTVTDDATVLARDALLWAQKHIQRPDDSVYVFRS